MTPRSVLNRTHPTTKVTGVHAKRIYEKTKNCCLVLLSYDFGFYFEYNLSNN